jgi:nitroimidazol reductase NimA-like FMN-containing flavoprotein (pyridoxamine 5'-phosphate oxidase superfamily)
MPDDAAIEDHLRKAQIGFIATSADDEPYVVPRLFWYDNATRRIYLHSALEGRTRRNVERNPRVCFSTGELGRLLPADTAGMFSTEYASVVIFGRAKVLEDEEGKRRGLQGLLDKYFPQLASGKDYRPITEDEIDNTAVYAIDIEGWSGKQKVAKP